MNQKNITTAELGKQKKTSGGVVTLVNYAQVFVIAGILLLSGYAALMAH
ncbi:hypothetical protein [Paraburkholderia humisilvae]|uniref:Uncharacterized protein n=1 Tax=Paraburkholderia humisilvae TaxID=627669 RepID=A0A6J5DLA2_9BURK|nr:hypothetical protein [Paraburkholderia humisilvae]CAB3754217.1 hypothetical protein LMG29542_02281 [Paraburkholderia humisilvae]